MVIVSQALKDKLYYVIWLLVKVVIQMNKSDLSCSYSKYALVGDCESSSER